MQLSPNFRQVSPKLRIKAHVILYRPTGGCSFVDLLQCTHCTAIKYLQSEYFFLLTRMIPTSTDENTKSSFLFLFFEKKFMHGYFQW